MRETWYILEDGSFGDPRLVALDDKGLLRHQNGVAVAMGAHGPRSSGVDVDDKGKPLFGGKGDHDGNGTTGGSKSRQMQAEKPKVGYKTRQTQTRR